MINAGECPECDGMDTERVYVEWHTDLVEETRICNDCPTQYTIGYGDPQIADVHTDD